MFSEDGSTYLCRISRQLFFQTVFKIFFDFCEFLSVFWFTQILVHFTGPSKVYSLDIAEVDAIAADSPVFTPLPAESGSMAENAEMKYKLEQFKELLNQVFEILGIAKIRDL